MPPVKDPQLRRVRFSGPVILLLALALFGCKPKNNMERQPSYRPDDPTALFNDVMSQRPLVTGVVPRPADQVPGVPYSAVRAAGPAGYPQTAPARSNPLPHQLRSPVARPGALHTIFCAVCHGRLGDGDGMIPRRGFQHPPSFHTQRLIDSPDGHYYDVITNGYGSMFSYSDRVTPRDRWNITAYIRALQAGVQQATQTQSISPQERSELEKYK